MIHDAMFAIDGRERENVLETLCFVLTFSEIQVTSTCLCRNLACVT